MATRIKDLINIGDTDENADWTKTKKNRKEERQIYEELKRKNKKSD